MFIDPDGMRNVPYDGGMISNIPEGSWWFAGMNGSFTPDYVVNSGLDKRTGGGSTQGTFGKTQAYADLMAAVQNGGDFSLKTNNGYMSWWTGGALGDANTAQEMVGHMLKLAGDGLLGLTNDIESASHSLMKYQTEDFFKDTEKHLNGQLGNANMIIDEYNKLSNINKINASTFLSAVSGIRAGKILRSTEGFMKSVGKISKRLGYVGTALTAGVTLYEFGTDTWDAHSIVNLGLLGATAVATFATAPVIVAAAPAILAGIAIYGVADYMFGVSDQLDKSIGRKSTIWYP
ncbi:hypothetical protein [Chryseobacterium viscerum]|uniref:hypothetical protein n=1 Tax=Chryseobacterium viscerum TaxID=1037377 RepID=UPI002221907C|nr:hypothetical protein [Chryseobacterium viscerum]MCW1961284.1 hypothetical protein [Chryseobacterium viscerum]